MTAIEDAASACRFSLAFANRSPSLIAHFRDRARFARFLSGWQARCFTTAAASLDHPRILRPSCLILDVDLADLNGLELQTQLLARSELSILFCTNRRDVSTSVQAMEARALEFLTKPIRDEALLNAISHAIHQSTIAVTDAENLRTIQARYVRLNTREREVMALVVAGRLNKLIPPTLPEDQCGSPCSHQIYLELIIHSQDLARAHA